MNKQRVYKVDNIGMAFMPQTAFSLDGVNIILLISSIV